MVAIRLSTLASASLTRMAETLAKRSVILRCRSSSWAGSTRKVAIWVCGALSRIPGEKTMTKLMVKVAQSSRRRLAMRPVTSRPRTLTVMLSPSLRPKASATLGIEGDQRRPLVIRRPPGARDEAAALGQGRCPGDAAIALEHPSLARGPRQLLHRHVVHARDAPAQHGNALEIAHPRLAQRQFVEGGDLVRLDVDEVEGGCARRHRLLELAGADCPPPSPPRPAP